MDSNLVSPQPHIAISSSRNRAQDLYFAMSDRMVNPMPILAAGNRQYSSTGVGNRAGMAGTFALDIETVSPGPEPTGEQFRDSAFFELVAVGVGHRPESDAPVETDVLLRADGSADAECDLIDAVCDWFAEREGDTLLTYNGTDFDVCHLLGRAELAAAEAERNGVRGRVAKFEALHDDLKPDAWDAWGEYTSLEDACEELGIETSATPWAAFEHGLDPDDWRDTRYDGRPEVKNVDIPHFGERYLALKDAGASGTLTCRELERLIRAYTVSDVEPLFELADGRPFGED